jgi:HAD superfamily hydrolase (TIGR01490 family)
MTIAFFDFDGTITSKDSLIGFIRFAVGDRKFLWGMFLLLPMLIRYKLKLIPNDIAKEKMLSYFFTGMDVKKFQKTASSYSLGTMEKIVRTRALKKIVWHQEEGHHVVVVSASMKCWLEPWCNKYDLTLISTQMEMKDGIVTGKFLTKNCHGAEKVNRIKEQYNLNSFQLIYAYGDSSGDRELLALADKSFYRPFL